MNGGPIREDAVTPVIILNLILPGPPFVLIPPTHTIFFIQALGYSTQTPGLRVLRFAGAARRLLTAREARSVLRNMGSHCHLSMSFTDMQKVSAASY